MKKTIALLVTLSLIWGLCACDAKPPKTDDTPTTAFTQVPTEDFTTETNTASTAVATKAPTEATSSTPTTVVTSAPTIAPTTVITTAPTIAPTTVITTAPTIAPTTVITTAPTTVATKATISSATTSITHEVNVNTKSEITAIYESLTTTKLPYTSKGLTIQSISFSSTKVTVRVTNNTGAAIDNLTHISYKCYDSNGTVLKTSNLYLEDLNNGETAEVYFYTESGTNKILFGDATIYKGNASSSQDTTIYSGIAVNTLPYTSKGLTIQSISFSGTKVSVRVTNNTGAAIDNLTHISYKCYDSNGMVLKTSNLYLEDLNNGETAEVYFYTESGTNKILFGDATIYKGNASSSQDTTIYSGIAVNTLPYTSKGLTIRSISFSGTKVSVRVTNNTGAAIDNLTHISYKCYDSNGTVLKTGNLYLEDLNNGETAKVYFYTESGTNKILFGDATIYR